MPAISRKTLVAKFGALGYEGPFSGGKHQFMIKGAKKYAYQIRTLAAK
jgi:hypothetical protein